MHRVTLVTGNQGKLDEYRALLSPSSKLAFTTHQLDLQEIQSLDLQVIVKDKLLRAFNQLQVPVIVEDVSAELESLNGLPGPFIKFFEQKLGKGALFTLAKNPGESVRIICIAGYYDGETTLFGVGELAGRIVAPRGKNGFGFDSVIIPNGEQRTMAEMSYDEKNHISHRAKAVESLMSQLLT